jgi:hypothetical protein
MKIIKKFTSFFRHKSPTLQEIIDSSIPRYQMEQEENIIDSPFVARIVKPAWSFWRLHFKWIIGTIISLIGLILYFT